MGINIRWLRSMLVILSSILSACVTAFAGPVSFVGIAVPHLVKQLMHTSKPILMIPGCFLGGSVCCLFCDLLARTMFAPTELSISTVTAFLARRWLFYSAPASEGEKLRNERLLFLCGGTGRRLSGKTDCQRYSYSSQAGEILTLIGPNGAGKSTVLKSIAKQLSPLEGTIRIGGESLDEIHGDALARKMAVVFTERIHSELMTCEDVVATGRYPYTGKFGILSKADYRVVDEAMRLVHVEELKGQNFAKISDGQRQRVMLARALAQEPEILLLDEPTSYLDVKYKLEFLTVLQEMTRKRS